MNIVSLSQTKSNKILANYDMRKEGSYVATVEEQVKKIFRKKTTIAALIIGIPLFILAWPLITSIIYGHATTQVNSALAHQRLSFINGLSNELTRAKEKTPDTILEEFIDSFDIKYDRIFKDSDKNSVIQLAKIYNDQPHHSPMDAIPLWETLLKINKQREKATKTRPTIQQPSPLPVKLSTRPLPPKTETSSRIHRQSPLHIKNGDTPEIEFKTHFLTEHFPQPGFPDYIEPNEYFPEGIEEHLIHAEEGIHVCTGTERLFFHLLYCDEEKCQGMIGRDINPKAMKYVAFNTLLLRISSSREEYVELSTPISSYDVPAFENRINLIKDKLAQNDLPSEVKEYYLKHLKNFGRVYLTAPQSWRANPAFAAVNYTENNEQFLKLQRFAKAGKIVPTIGSINDLSFLENQQIAAIDASNIHYYTPLDFKLGQSSSCPRVISTVVGNRQAPACIYSSFLHTSKRTSRT